MSIYTTTLNSILLVLNIYVCIHFKISIGICSGHIHIHVGSPYMRAVQVKHITEIDCDLDLECKYPDITLK